MCKNFIISSFCVLLIREYDDFDGCPAVAYGTYESFYKKDPQCWR